MRCCISLGLKSWRIQPRLGVAAFWCVLSLALLFSILLSQTGIAAESALSSHRQQQLHAHVQSVLRSPLPAEPKELVRNLVAPASNELERAWLVYRFVAGRIEHNEAAAKRLGNPAKYSVSELLRHGKGSCAVYAHVTQQMLTHAGIESRMLTGKARVSTDGGRMGNNHAWNQVKVDGQWWTMDTTWGAGYVDERGFVREVSDDYFLVSPKAASLSYFDPNDSLGAQREMGLNASVFAKIDEGALLLAGLGFEPQRVLQAAKQGAGLVQTFEHPHGAFKVLSAPVEERLPRAPVGFEIKTAVFVEVVAVQDEHWVKFEAKGAVHRASLNPRPGELLIMGRRAGEADYEALLEYRII